MSKKEKKLTKAQRAKLLKAIELAKDPGKCRYVVDGKPSCVIGQLAALEGVKLATLQKWDTAFGGQQGTAGIQDVYPLTRTAIRKYPLGLLRELQFRWDAAAKNADRSRAAMCETVIAHD